MFGIGKSAEERQKEKERKKRGTRKYGQADLKHSHMGIVSCFCAVGAFLILVGCILYAYITRGQTAGIVGGLAVLSFILAVFGMRAAIKGFRERERNYLTCKIGLPADVVALILFLAIFIGGLGS